MSGWLDRRRLPIGGRRPGKGGNKGGGNSNPGSGPKGGGGGGRGRGRGGGGGGGDAANGYYVPTYEVDTVANLVSSDMITRTTDGTNNLNLRNKIQVVIRNLTFTGTLTGITVQVREQSGGTWRTAGTSYEYQWLSAGTDQTVTAGAGVPITQLAVPTDLSFQIRGLGIAVPTMIWAWEMTAAQDEKWISGWATDAEVCDAFRIVFTGTSLNFTGGTFEAIYFT